MKRRLASYVPSTTIHVMFRTPKIAIGEDSSRFFEFETPNHHDDTRTDRPRNREQRLSVFPKTLHPSSGEVVNLERE